MHVLQFTSMSCNLFVFQKGLVGTPKPQVLQGDSTPVDDGQAIVAAGGKLSPHELLSPGEMLAQVHQMMMQLDPNRQEWLHELPVVSIKEAYLNCPELKVKGEGVDRASWPKHLKKDFLKMAAFKAYMGEHLNKKDSHVKQLNLGVGRALGALEVNGEPVKGDGLLGDITVMVALYTSGVYAQLLKLPLYHPKFTWTLWTIDGLILFCQFCLRELAQKASCPKHVF